jgi:hypothetical protein
MTVFWAVAPKSGLIAQKMEAVIAYERSVNFCRLHDAAFQKKVIVLAALRT